MFDESYLKSAGQMWKVYLFFMAFPVVGFALIGFVLKGMVEDRINLSIFLVLLGLGLGALGFVLGILTVSRSSNTGAAPRVGHWPRDSKACSC